MRSIANSKFFVSTKRRFILCAGAILLGTLFGMSANAVTLNVVDEQGNAITCNTPPCYRWTLEEDNTKDSVPGQLADNSNLSLSFHASYMQVIAKGSGSAELEALTLDPAKRYYVSVMPNRDMVNALGQPLYQLGGAQIGKNQGSVTVKMIKGSVPTAQISAFIFEDNQPINGAPDLPEEQGLGGFSVYLVEAGGTYGASGGQVTKNAFGDPIGTEYKFTTNAAGERVPVLNADGTPVIDKLGKGFVVSSSRASDLGVVHFKYLVPAKYTLTAVPPGGSNPKKPDVWHQTSTIEGTKGIDAWVKGNEPSYFAEFGPPGHHVFIGFVKDINDTTALNGSQTITGRIVNMHTARPPEYTFHPGEPIEACRIGLNRVPGDGMAIFTAPCADGGTFAIPNVPPGTYELAIWDDPLDLVIALKTVTVPNDGTPVALGDVPVFNWFHRHTSRVFYDADENGFWDDNPAEYGMPDQTINIRFRDGSIYQSSATGAGGMVEFKEVFPFFNWMVLEVDFLRYKATGATIVVDGGGPVPPDNGWTMPSRDKLTPQLQTENDNKPYRTETGPVLVQGMQGFLGTTNLVDWGKKIYAPGENGGIAGIVHYAITRAENDPRYAAAENWEPGVPRVRVNLYRDCNGDGIIDQPNTNPGAELPNTSSGCQSLGDPNTNPPQLSDVDNYPFGWADGGLKGPEDVDRTGTVDGQYDTGWAIDVSSTDSWDDNLPSGCQGDVFVSNGTVTDCYDGLRNYNQVRPALFDGGYAFGGSASKPELEAGTYIVEAYTPPGYDLVKEEDKNVDFGDTYTPSVLALPAPCVGDPHVVPAELSLVAGVEAPYAGDTRPLCDRKSVRVADGLNAAADFFLFTEVPIAGHIVGMILDDTANEFDPNAPTFGERYAPSWVPVSLRDWTGKEIGRVYADQWGTYNALVPSTFTVNPPMPSGVGPNMVTACMNHAGPIIDQRPESPTYGQSIIDPYFQRQYSQFCYTFQYLPGKTTYLDTPVVPVAAFAGPDQSALDCEFVPGTPVIYSVEGLTSTGASHGGPYVPNIVNTAQPHLKIISAGLTEVSNPAFNGTNSKTIQRDFGFGAARGTVKLNGLTIPDANIITWTSDLIEVSVPRFIGGVRVTTGQLEVTRGDNNMTTVDGVTVTVGTATSPAPILVAPGGSIQAAVNAASKGDLILVAPGTYVERVIMDKQVSIQGWGAPSTVINLAGAPTESLQAWRDLVNQKFAAGTFDLVQGQTTGFDPANNEPMLFTTEEGPAFLVVAKHNGATRFTATRNARIDGFTITGADSAGAIFVNGYANYLEISNNKIIGNSGSFGGGIRFGHPMVTNDNFVETDLRGGYTDSSNDYVHVHHNQITQNGGVNEGAVAGGVGISAGTDGYRINGNYICGNFSMGGGAGIGHLGNSANGMIDGNTILFNQSFNQGGPVHGGGILVAGQSPMGVGPSAGSGSVAILNNLIQGNQAGAGDGGGVSLMFVNGGDVAAAPNDPTAWYKVTMRNNKIVNNVAGLAGGGVALQDVVSAEIVNNTIANNDSTATTGTAFAPGSPNTSTPQSAGLVSRAHSALLVGTGVNVGTFSNPILDQNILWHNRTFYWNINRDVNPPVFGLVPDIAAGQAPVYSDLAVLGTANQGSWPQFTDTADKLSPTNSVLTHLTGYEGAGNTDAAPVFPSEYVNGARDQTIIVVEGVSNIGAVPAFDEGGNFIDVHYGPLSPSQACAVEPCAPNGDYVLPDPNLIAQVTFGDMPATAPFVPTAVDPVVVDPTPENTAVFVQCPDDSNGDAIPELVYTITVTGVAGNPSIVSIQIDGIEILTGNARLAGNVTLSLDERLARGIRNKVGNGYSATVSGNVVSITKPGSIMGTSVMTYVNNLSFTTATLTGTPPRNVKCMHLSGGDGFIRMADGKTLYTFGYADLTGTLPQDATTKGTLAANFPAPTISLKEGEEFFLTLTNVGMTMRPDLFDPHTVHFHGFPQAAPVFDGMPEGSFGINMGASLTYYYNIVEPGTYLYHCHQEATEHMQMGMLGNLYVTPKQDGQLLGGYTKFVYNDGDGSTGYNVAYPLQMASMDHNFHELHLGVQPLPFAEMKDTYAMLNGRGYPDTVFDAPLEAPILEDGTQAEVQSQVLSSLVKLDRTTQGNTLLLRLSDVSVTKYYTLTALGLPMRVVGAGAHIARGPGGKDLYYQTSSVTLGGGEAVEVIIDTKDVAEGTYFLYTTNLNYLSNNEEDYGGMMTEIVITGPAQPQ